MYVIVYKIYPYMFSISQFLTKIISVQFLFSLLQTSLYIKDDTKNYSLIIFYFLFF